MQNINDINPYISLFNTSDLHLYDANINYLNKYLAEFCTYYFVYMNDLKSDYVGFCHYRRHFLPPRIHSNVDYIQSDINFNRLNHKEIQGLYPPINMKYNDGLNFIQSQILWFTIINYLRTYEKLNISVNDFFNYGFYFTSHCSFIFNWHNFKDIFEICLRFFNYLVGDITNEHNIIKFISNYNGATNHFYKEYMFRNMHFNDNNRLLSYIFEIFIGIIVNMKYYMTYKDDNSYGHYLYYNDISDKNYIDINSPEFQQFLEHWHKHRKYGSDRIYIIFDKYDDKKDKYMFSQEFTWGNHIFFIDKLEYVSTKHYYNRKLIQYKL